MEASLYPVPAANKMMKKEISLNPEEQSAELKANPLRDAGIINSQDLGLLKLASPDLERLIIQSHPNSHFMFPKSASEEQEFAEGFVKALEDLHKQNQLSDASQERLELLGPPGAAGIQPSDLPVYTTLNGYGAPLGAAVHFPTDTLPFPPPTHAAALSRLQQSGGGMKDEPQTVPDMQSCGDSPPLSPIDMDNQERIKAERKKLRNRIAASKCRKRKLERISRLEEKVKTLKTQNTELASTASVLREQVAQLKQKVMSHVSSGCQLLPNQVQAY
ncbi:transcription factor jun-D-like [Cyprinodon tularosa]|uniref:transcription factor jun-D-like n=1 Tax=Cyprinodon tularosa TaxID=77115 RepID=UPI0018E23A4A|nr:transcription factor jun-D-like [Cyprinodon tularosa]